MTNETLILAGTAASIGFMHTVLGPDHYIPFIAMAKARKWSALRTAVITGLCGVGHIVGSILLGFIGVFLGIVVFKLESIESVRGNLAGWLLMAFGLAYLIWGLHRAARNKPHEHVHVHEDGTVHSHRHTHVHAHAHAHGEEKARTLTPWILFTIFVLGPCEPLIPLIMYPAAKLSVGAVALVALVFGLATIGTMLACVMAGYYGLSRISLPRLERHAHALAGLTILLCGAAIQFLGL